MAHPACPHCHDGSRVRAHVAFRRADDSRTIQRYRCAGCRRTFSGATLSPSISGTRAVGRVPMAMASSKAGGWDDLMPINGFNAMLRANLVCLVRRSGSLSKQVENLAYRLHIAFWYHVSELLPRCKRPYVAPLLRRRRKAAAATAPVTSRPNQTGSGKGVETRLLDTTGQLDQ